MAHSAVGQNNDDRNPNAPVHLAVPMGFGPAAGLAQAVTDTATIRAELPTPKRVASDQPVTKSFPVWGSILDDVWSIEQNTDSGGEEDIAQAWVAAVKSRRASTVKSQLAFAAARSNGLNFTGCAAGWAHP